MSCQEVTEQVAEVFPNEVLKEAGAYYNAVSQKKQFSSDGGAVSCQEVTEQVTEVFPNAVLPLTSKRSLRLC